MIATSFKSANKRFNVIICRDKIPRYSIKISFYYIHTNDRFCTKKIRENYSRKLIDLIIFETSIIKACFLFTFHESIKYLNDINNCKPF